MRLLAVTLTSFLLFSSRSRVVRCCDDSHFRVPVNGICCSVPRVRNTDEEREYITCSSVDEIPAHFWGIRSLTVGRHGRVAMTLASTVLYTTALSSML